MTTAWADVFKELPSLRRAWSEVGRSVVGRSVVGRDAALGDPAGDEGLELFCDRRVHRWRLVRGQELLPDAVGLGGQLRGARLLPRLVITPIAEHRLVERGLVARLRVLGPEEVATWAYAADRIEPERVRVHDDRVEERLDH